MLFLMIFPSEVVENANNVIPIVTSQPPEVPRTVLNAAIVISEPVRNSPAESVIPSTPEEAIASPVMVHTTIVSQNVPVILIYPCRTGLSVVAAAAVIAAEPIPASFENTPLATP